MKLRIGQIIYLKPVNNELRRNKEVRAVEIVKIGRKWFTVKEPNTDGSSWQWKRDRFDINTLNHDGGGYVNSWDGYLTLQDIEKEKEHSRLSSELSKFFSRWNRSSLSLEKLQKMYKIACS